MIKFKTFFGGQTNRADETANIWLSRNPNIRIIQMQYQQARYGDHSICIMYEDGINSLKEEMQKLSWQDYATDTLKRCITAPYIPDKEET